MLRCVSAGGRQIGSVTLNERYELFCAIREKLQLGCVEPLAQPLHQEGVSSISKARPEPTEEEAEALRGCIKLRKTRIINSGRKLDLASS
jgi:hypothetical protein